MDKTEYCKGCPYEKNDSSPVEGVRMDKNVLLVMQSPGANENKSGRPLSGIKGSSATQILKELLPSGKTIDDYAVTELVKCYPNGDTLDRVAVAICYRYLETEILEGDYKKIVCFCADAFPIVENIKSRYSKDFKLVKCSYYRIY